MYKNGKKGEKMYKLLGTSWRVQTRMFFQHSTLHGVRYIAEKDRPFLEKFMWFVCVTIGAVATIVIILSLWEKFQTNPTITGLDTDFHNWDVPFPSVTICQDVPSNQELIEKYALTYYIFSDLIFILIKNSNGAKATQPDNTVRLLSHFPELPKQQVVNYLMKLTQLSLSTLNNFVNQSKILSSDTDLKQLVFGLMNKCEDIFEICEWKSYNYNCCEGFFPVFTERGFCYVFNSRHYEKIVPWIKEELPDFNMEYIKETDIKWALKFFVKDNSTKMPIYILYSDEQAGIDVQPQHIWDFKVDVISFSVRQTYTTEDTKQLSIKQRHCVFSDEIKLNVDHMYTYTACTRQCRMDNSMRKCNCIPHFYPEVTQNGYFYRHCNIEQLNCIAEHLKEIEAIDSCSCQLSCLNTVYEVEKLIEESFVSSKSLEISFSSWPMVRYKREVLFGWVDLLVSFGGIAGLFLGFSLLSGVEILYYFTIRLCCMLYKEKETLEQLRYEETNKSPVDYDLSLLPYFIRRPDPGNGLNEVAKNYYKRKHNMISPIMEGKKWQQTILPPFGIEFIN